MTDSTNIILYDYWRSSASYRVRIALNLKGLVYQSVKVDLLNGEHQSPAYLARNPQGTVPMLEIDGLCLTQSLAILEYLEEAYPTPALLPDDAKGRAFVRALALIFVADTHPIQNLNVAQHVTSLMPDKPEVKEAWMRHFINKGLTVYEKLLADSISDSVSSPVSDSANSQFSYGPNLTIADICLIPQIYNARRWGVDMAQFPSILSIEAACKDIQAFVLAEPEAVQ
ncbi:MAG: maleylacetoacetate isomerase [Alphaproteobacteria bacterium]|nr:maleylacetoacetate isomerase [Alphaproteobacteria bacterium]